MAQIYLIDASVPMMACSSSLSTSFATCLLILAPEMLLSGALSRVSRRLTAGSFLLSAPKKLQTPSFSAQFHSVVCESPNKLVTNNVSFLHHPSLNFSAFQRLGISSSASLKLSEKEHGRAVANYGQKAIDNISVKRKISEKRNLGDHKRRMLAAKYELRRKLHKAICKESDLPIDMREKHRSKLSKLPRNSSFTRIRNRCIFTGRPRAVYETFRMSRIVFRELASQGSLMGIKKASW